jgi:hypothetical protein
MPPGGCVRAGRFQQAVVLAALCAGCSPGPVEIAERLAARDPTLAARLRPAAEGWRLDDQRVTSPGWRASV